MASTGTAFATKTQQILVGPVQTQAGFSHWYLICSSDCIIAVRQGMWAGILLSLSGPLSPIHMLGLIPIILSLVNKHAVKRRRQIEADIPKIPGSRLRMAPNQVYYVSKLRSIVLNGRSIGGLITPDITLEMISGSRRKFGMMKFDYDNFMPQLIEMYPNLCQLP